MKTHSSLLGWGREMVGEPKGTVGEAKGMLGTALPPPCKVPLLGEQELWSSAFPPAVWGLQYEPLDAEWCWKTSQCPGFGAINLLDLTDWQSAVLWNSAKQTQGQLWHCSQLDKRWKKEGWKVEGCIWVRDAE